VFEATVLLPGMFHVLVSVPRLSGVPRAPGPSRRQHAAVGGRDDEFLPDRGPAPSGKALEREDGSFTDLVDRPIDETTVDRREPFGSLPAEGAADLERIAAESRRSTGRGLADRQERAIAAFADVGDGDERGDGEGADSDGA